MWQWRGSAGPRATGTRAHVSMTQTAQASARLKVSLVASVQAFVVAASVLRNASCCLAHCMYMCSVKIYKTCMHLWSHDEHMNKIKS